MTLKPPTDPNENFTNVQSIFERSHWPVNVKDSPYRATGNGVTDDTVAIQAALDAAVGNAVYFPLGTYIVSSVRPSSSTYLYGPGTLKQKSGTLAGGCCILINTSITDVIIDGLEINGNKANQTDGLGIHGIRIAGLRNTVANCYIHDCEYNGVSFQEGGGDGKVLNNFIYDCGTQNLADPTTAWGHGVNGEGPIAGISNLLIEGNHIVRTGQHGVRGGDDCHHWSVHDNTFLSIGHDCFAAYNVGNTHLSFTDNNINTTALAGTHLGGTDLSAHDNTMTTVGGVGVLFGSTPNTDPVASSGGSITGNVIHTPLACGIETRNFSRVTISNNEIDQSAVGSGVQQGILCQGNYGATVTLATDITIGPNVVYRARGACLQFSSVTDSTITGGSYRFSLSRGLRISNSKDLAITGVDSSDNTLDGLFADGATTAPDEITISGGKWRRNGGFGIRFNAGGGTTITGANLVGNTSGVVSLNGVVNKLQNNKLDVAELVTNSTNASFTLTPFTSAETTLYTAAQTANRTCTLSTTNAQTDQVFRVVDKSSGGFNVDFGPGLKTLVTGQFVEARYNGSAWVETAFGAL